MVHSRITFMVKKKKSLFIVWGSLVPHVTSGISLISQHSVQFHLNTGAGAAHMRHQQGTFAGWWRPCVCSCRWFATHTKLSRRALKCNDIGLRPFGRRSWTSMWARQTPSSSVSPVCCTVAWWSASILQASQSFNKKREGQVLASEGRDGEVLSSRPCTTLNIMSLTAVPTNYLRLSSSLFFCNHSRFNHPPAVICN